MKSLFISISVLSICFLLLSLSDAHMYEKVPFMSSANPVGSGARAMGMGGAFISIADDATATSWNPSGLVQLDRKESSFVHVLGHRIERDRFLVQPVTSARQSVNCSDLNYYFLKPPLIAVDPNRFYRSGERNNDMLCHRKKSIEKA
jgi:hypothetical protein